MNVLVTGGAGYVGSHAAKLLASEGHEIWVYDNLVFGHRAAVSPGRRSRATCWIGARSRRCLRASGSTP